MSVRTTIDIPSALFRKTKAISALRGISLKALIVSAIEKKVSGATGVSAGKKARMKLPLVRLKGDRPLDLSGINFDDLLA